MLYKSGKLSQLWKITIFQFTRGSFMDHDSLLGHLFGRFVGFIAVHEVPSFKAKRAGKSWEVLGSPENLGAANIGKSKGFIGKVMVRSSES